MPFDALTGACFGLVASTKLLVAVTFEDWRAAIFLFFGGFCCHCALLLASCLLSDADTPGLRSASAFSVAELLAAMTLQDYDGTAVPLCQPRSST